MTEAEYADIVELLRGWWDGEFSDATARAWGVELLAHPAPDVYAALRERLHEGKPWRPKLPELLELLERDHSTPTWPEAFQAIFGAGGILSARPPRGRRYGHEGERQMAERQAILDRAALSHPLIDVFVTQYIDQLRDARVFHEGYGWKERDRLGAQWTEFVATGRARHGHAIATGAPRGALGPHRVDPLRALPALADELADIEKAGKRTNGDAS
jgi:hypothetical protein